jgi:hypothetical protein
MAHAGARVVFIGTASASAALIGRSLARKISPSRIVFFISSKLLLELPKTIYKLQNQTF